MPSSQTPAQIFYNYNFSYFTVVGPRKVLYGNNYIFYLTNMRDGNLTAILNVTIEALKTGEELGSISVDLTYNIEQEYLFYVSYFQFLSV